MKLLVIDDDPNIAQAISLAFSMQWQGVEVRVAYDGSSGLDAFFETQPDVILLDVGSAWRTFWVRGAGADSSHLGCARC